MNKTLFLLALLATSSLVVFAQGKIVRIERNGNTTDLFTDKDSLPAHVETSQKVKTVLYDNHDNLPLAGGVIASYSNDIVAKLLIVSVSRTNLALVDYMPTTNPYCYAVTEDNQWGISVNTPSRYRIIDCTDINREQFFCYLMALQPHTTYYVRSALVYKDSSVAYGNIVSVTTPGNYKRMDGKLDYANVWNKQFEYTTLDLVTDEIIDACKNGYVYSSNEDPQAKRIVVKDGMVHAVDPRYAQQPAAQPLKKYWNTCYKFACEWNYVLWLTHAKHLLNNEDDIVDEPVITQNGSYVEMHCGDGESIHYEINQKGPTRPNDFSHTYSAPFRAKPGDIIKAYSINTITNFVSYTNVFVVQ